ncbi:class I tRNA ligase family protein, partial [Patescibacteria group bacterium]
MDNAYRTMDLDYMESVIWVFKELYKKNLIYKGVRTSLYCTRCGTPISNFEIAMDNSYKPMKDPAVTVKFKIKNPDLVLNSGKKDIFFLAWTTTPWTLPSNRALVVDENEPYLLIEVNKQNDVLILAKKRIKAVLENKKYKVIKTIKGKKLLGLEYHPPYTFFPPNKKDFKVYSYNEMVNMEEGTGIVHSAPGFGDIDTKMGQDLGLTIMFSVDDEGKFVEKVEKWKG